MNLNYDFLKEPIRLKRIGELIRIANHSALLLYGNISCKMNSEVLHATEIGINCIFQFSQSWIVTQQTSGKVENLYTKFLWESNCERSKIKCFFQDTVYAYKRTKK